MSTNTTLAKVPRLKTGDDQQVAEKLDHLFQQAQNGLRSVIALGLFCYEIKANLAHGQFGPWIKANRPSISYRSLRSYMQLTASVLEKCKIQIGKALPICRGGEILLLPEAKVPEEAKPLREKICSIIDGKSQSQLFLEFKQVDEDDDALKPKRGRRKGEGGATKDQRARAAAAEAQAEIEAMELDAQDFDRWIDKVSDLKGLPRISDKVWDRHFERVKFHYEFMRSVNEARKATRRAA